MLDYGNGSIEGAVECLYNCYTVVCIMEDMEDVLSMEEFQEGVEFCYHETLKARSEMSDREDVKILECPLHEMNGECNIWLRGIIHEDRSISLLLAKVDE